MFGIGMFAVSADSVGVGTYINYFWSDIALISLASISTILLVSRFLDGVTDIIVGFLVDRTKSKHGKARAWLLWMAVPATISLIALFYVPNISETGKVIYYFITYNLVSFFFGTAIAIPLQSLTARLTTDAKVRLNLNMVGQGFGTAAIILGNMFVVKGIAALGGGSQGYFNFFGLIALLTGALILVCFRGVKEKVETDASRQENRIGVMEGFRLLLTNKWWILITLVQIISWTYPALMGINIYYMIWTMKNPALMGPFMSAIFFAMFFAIFLFAPLAQKVGKIPTAFTGMFFQIVGGLLPLINPASVPLLMVAGVFRGIGPTAMLGTRFAFTCDVVEYGEWKNGKRNEGLIFAGASMGQKIGMGLGGAVVSMMLAWGGYVGGAATQSANALNAINITFTWLSALSSLLVVVCLYLLMGLEKQMPQIMKELNERKGITDAA